MLTRLSKRDKTSHPKQSTSLLFSNKHGCCCCYGKSSKNHCFSSFSAFKGQCCHAHSYHTTSKGHTTTTSEIVAVDVASLVRVFAYLNGLSEKRQRCCCYCCRIARRLSEPLRLRSPSLHFRGGGRKLIVGWSTSCSSLWMNEFAAACYVV